MATGAIIALPPGFILDTPAASPQASSGGLPAGFVLDAAPTLPQATTDNPSALPDGGMGALRRLASKIPDIGGTQPWDSEKPDAEGSKSYHARALHDALLLGSSGMRGALNAGADLLEGTKTGELTPQAVGLIANLAGARGLGMRSAATRAAPEAAILENAVPATAQQTLQDAGVSLTPGQRLGGVAKSMEDKTTSLPILGDTIQGARGRGMDAFNIGTINKALEPIGASLPKDIPAGHGAIEAGQNALSAAYEQVLPKLRFSADAEFDAANAQLRELVSEMPASDAAQFESIFKNRVAKRLGPEGNMDGTTLTQVQSELTQKVGQLKADKQYQLSDAVRQLRANIGDALERQNPDDAPELSKIQQAYAMFSRVEDAAIRRATSDGTFTPADLLQAIKSNAVRTGNRKAFARGDQFLQDLAQAGQDVLPSKVPDSGTTGRAIVNAGVLGGGAVASPVSIAALLTAAGAYTKPGMAITNAVMDAAPAIGGTIGRQARGAAQTTAKSSVMFGQAGDNQRRGLLARQ